MPETPKDTKNDPPIFAFFNEIGIIEQLARNRFEQVLPDGLRISHFSVLNHFVRLDREETPVQLARNFQVTKGAMTNTLQRLEARGLVEIRPHPTDGRGKLVRITEAGRAARARSIAALAPVLAKLNERFPEQAFRDGLPLLRELRQFLDKARD